MLSGAMLRTCRRTDGRIDIDQKKEVHNFNSYTVDLKRFQVDCIKTLGQVQSTRLKKKSLVALCRRLCSVRSDGQTDGQTSIKNRRCTTSTHI